MQKITYTSIIDGTFVNQTNP